MKGVRKKEDTSQGGGGFKGNAVHKGMGFRTTRDMKPLRRPGEISSHSTRLAAKGGREKLKTGGLLEKGKGKREVDVSKAEKTKRAERRVLRARPGGLLYGGWEDKGRRSREKTGGRRLPTA